MNDEVEEIDGCDVDWESEIVEKVFDRIQWVPTPEEYSDCVEEVRKILCSFGSFARI